METLVQSKRQANGSITYATLVRKCGPALFLSKYGQPFEVTLTVDERQKNLDRIMRSFDPTNPQPAISVELTTPIGSFQMCAALSEHMAAAMFCDMVDEDLGDLLEQYPPLN